MRIQLGIDLVLNNLLHSASKGPFLDKAAQVRLAVGLSDLELLLQVLASQLGRSFLLLQLVAVYGV